MRLVCAALFVLAGLGLQAAPKAEPVKTLPVLRRSPEFVIKFVDGHQTLLSSYKGKVIALLMVHTTCPHCQHTSQVFTQFQTDYGPRGFQALDVAFNTMANLYVNDFVKTYNIGYPVGFGTPEDVLGYLGFNVLQRYTVPQIVFIDKKFNIRSQTPAAGDDPSMYTEDYWRGTIEALLKEPAAGATTHHRSTAAGAHHVASR
ncbi:MAG TPA: TlpA disulfide reductase family protein [Bryobacteraceae bacterium]|nr:TlpA disulfide reductase family protein [Bryobacteraceae bacterium]